MQQTREEWNRCNRQERNGIRCRDCSTWKPCACGDVCVCRGVHAALQHVGHAQALGEGWYVLYMVCVWYGVLVTRRPSMLATRRPWHRHRGVELDAEAVQPGNSVSVVMCVYAGGSRHPPTCWPRAGLRRRDGDFVLSVCCLAGTARCGVLPGGICLR